MPDDAEYLTVAEFADLTSDQQHAVWAAHYQGQVAAVGRPGNSYRYRRADVEQVLQGPEAGRG